MLFHNAEAGPDPLFILGVGFGSLSGHPTMVDTAGLKILFLSAKSEVGSSLVGPSLYSGFPVKPKLICGFQGEIQCKELEIFGKF